jgi:hypothetical protein
MSGVKHVEGGRGVDRVIKKKKHTFFFYAKNMALDSHNLAFD